MKATGIVRNDQFLEHTMGDYHPESPRRLEVVYEMLNEPGMKGRFMEIPARKAAREELLVVHSPEYIDLLVSTRGRKYTYLDPDTEASAGSYDAALLAAGGVCEAVSAVDSGLLDNAFALVRPPGHHAEKHRAMGFCLVNNVAVAAEFARKELGLKKILIADWDLHHGNGTQNAFESDPGILYFSTHQYPLFPGSGAFSETGTGAGKGYTMNIPLPAGCGDAEYAAVFDHILKPVALEFDPDLVLVSAGFDTSAGDPIGGMRVSSGGFVHMAGAVMDIAASCCGGKLVLTLEGGYNLDDMRNSVKAVLDRLDSASDGEDGERRAPAGGENDALRTAGGGRLKDMIMEEIRKTHGRYWSSL